HYDAATVPSTARFRPSTAGTHCGGAPFFDTRPILGQPAGHRQVVVLAGHTLRLLGSVSPLPQPGRQVVRVEVNVPFLLDELGEAPGGPQFGGKAVLGRAVGEPAPDDLLR